MPALDEWQRAQYWRRTGWIVLANSAESVGKVLLAPTSRSTGARSWMVLPPDAVAPAQLRTHTVMVSPQAEFADSQQLWPPPTLVTRRDWSGVGSVTRAVASWYARFTSSLRAKRGDWPVALWQAPQRLLALTFSQRLSLNAWTSAFAGAGPLYSATGGATVTGFSCVGAPPLEQAPSTARVAIAAALRAKKANF